MGAKIYLDLQLASGWFEAEGALGGGAALAMLLEE